MIPGAIRAIAHRLWRARVIPTIFFTPPYLRIASLGSWYRWDRLHGLYSMSRYGVPFTLPIPFTPYMLTGYWCPLTHPWQPLPEPRPDTRLKIRRRTA